ncbi:MAG: hypothetical protein H6Q89_4014 [Myxococcaceae bacterium]|nr:hypothetical protein [Myxococcaceae bacterium]
MKKLIAMLAVGGAVLSGVAMGMSSHAQQIDDAQVQAKIDARLHDLLVKARLERQAH